MQAYIFLGKIYFFLNTSFQRENKSNFTGFQEVFLKYAYLITCFALINLVLKKNKPKAANMTAKYLHQDLSHINRFYNVCSEKLHFWLTSVTDYNSGGATWETTMLKGVCIML